MASGFGYTGEHAALLIGRIFRSATLKLTPSRTV
ncbi:hypothetical protein J056_000587 [Wallemia ichthyophaga EXF-994]|uniref:Uncharacterized protein n=1 Tax=Wallemia ichthyophaga (strain EXF-994 / CBS 113033) TaxID=1299270 RepID=R9AF43_WALI9|nr:uncharacterized protein J056_000587 [Wallemia ichthyophaga EXF-994]EOR00777.1 hypothetical protein J056_000587 [Wallemia ichthyophaga EXF-994]